MQTETGDDAKPSAISMSHLNTLSLVALGFAFLAIMLIVARVRPMPDLMKALEDFDTRLPEITIFVIRIPRILYFAGCLACCVALAIKEWKMRDKGVTLLVNVAATGIAMAIWVAIEYAFLLPIFTLIQSVSK